MRWSNKTGGMVFIAPMQHEQRVTPDTRFRWYSPGMDKTGITSLRKLDETTKRIGGLNDADNELIETDFVDFLKTIATGDRAKEGEPDEQ